MRKTKKLNYTLQNVIMLIYALSNRFYFQRWPGYNDKLVLFFKKINVQSNVDGGILVIRTLQR